MARWNFLLAFCAVVLVLGCRREQDGDRLFEVTYPVITFPLRAGAPSFSGEVIAQDRLQTDFAAAIARAGVTAEDVDLVGGLRARVTSLTGDDFGEFRRIELRACPVGQDLGCDRSQVLFSVDDLFRRRQLTVDLNPSLVNARNLFLGEEVRVELVLFPAEITSVSFEARLEWSVQAVGNLD